MKQFFEAYKREIIMVVLGLVIFIIIKRNWYKVAGFLNPATVTNSPDPLTDTRKNYIEGIASDMYQDIYSTGWFGHDYSSYDKALALYDNEIQYLADYYRNHLASGNKLYDDINSQWYTTGDSPIQLMNKLKDVGKA